MMPFSSNDEDHHLSNQTIYYICQRGSGYDFRTFPDSGPEPEVPDRTCQYSIPTYENAINELMKNMDNYFEHNITVYTLSWMKLGSQTWDTNDLGSPSWGLGQDSSPVHNVDSTSWSTIPKFMWDRAFLEQYNSGQILKEKTKLIFGVKLRKPGGVNVEHLNFSIPAIQNFGRQ